MINQDTLFILGAGASRPYGFPTALELRYDIINNFEKDYIKFMKEECRVIDTENNPFYMHTKQMIEVFKKSSTSSIDLFITRNRKYYDDGKNVIAFLLSNYEISSSFREESKSPNEDWYFYLYNILTKDITNANDIMKISDNKLSIITFNYDRSLEHFLYESLTNSFIGKQNEAKEIINKINIQHIYGKLSPLDWESSNGVNYKSKELRHLFKDNSKNIQIVFDERKNNQENIINLIINAQKIFFLGFGYATENIAALGINKSILKRNQKIYGTALDHTNAEIYKIKTELKGENEHMPLEKYDIEDCNSLTLLKTYLT